MASASLTRSDHLRVRHIAERAFEVLSDADVIHHHTGGLVPGSRGLWPASGHALDRPS